MTKARDIASAIPAPSTVSSAELGYLDGVTSAIQTQLDAKTAKSTLTTTGDIYYASSANTPARLGIGSTGNVLTVASGIPSWAAPAGGGFVGCLATVTASTQSISNSSATAVTFPGTDVYDTDAFHNPASNNSRITIPAGLGGYYQVYGQVGWADNATGRRLLYLRKNNNVIYYSEGFASGSGLNSTLSVMVVVELAASDYLELFVFQNSGTSVNILGDSSNTFFGVVKQ
jgi:hypothetical protein